MTREEAIRLLVHELDRAESIHPIWPNDVVDQAAILGEEAGETIKAALDNKFEGAPLSEMRKEAAQTGAMALRVLMHLKSEAAA